MKSYQQISDDARHVTFDAALDELRREIKQRIGTEAKPFGAYVRWANAEPNNFSKHRQYEQQTARLIAALMVLETLKNDNWARRLHAASQPQKSLF